MRRSGWPAAVEPPLRRAGGEGTPRPAPPQVLLANSGTPGMKKNYVLDTNILLHDPSAIFKFEDNHVIIPIYVIEEVDQFKREGSERGRNARQVVRLLDDLRDAGGALSKGVPLKSGGMLRVAVPPRVPGEAANAFEDHELVQRDRVIQKQLHDLGLGGYGGVTVPVEYGGLGLDRRFEDIFFEEADDEVIGTAYGLGASGPYG